MRYYIVNIPGRAPFVSSHKVPGMVSDVAIRLGCEITDIEARRLARWEVGFYHKKRGVFVGLAIPHKFPESRLARLNEFAR